ncbi:Lipopolysaccharide transport system ATP-binding protein [Flavobacterium sp. 9R]|uniref:ABC transporter ATP-binding protein n=1 Tax=Flavobacterium sp. 9R TaxID=2653143 RepID=UPI0012F38547|nr:ABC transporter ATP-binding protein [Flavobacterium sp. 9R]VXC16169.1 Lipopolysaccharide transport system ATP-binding protein [Flavobacterium sp. 9R]
MGKDIILKAENISKQYRLGTVGTGTLSHDLNRWWHKIRGKEDPYLRIGETNDRTTKGASDYVWALQDINFEVQRGEVLGIIGKNGAGKSTLLKILSKVTAPTTGSIKSRGRIASLLEVGTGFNGELTGRENVYLNGAILGMTKKEITAKLDEIIAFSGCERYIDTPVKRYSSGMTVRLAFAVAAFLEPEILVIDEVLAVGDAEFQKKAIGKMQDISKGEGRTVLFVSHNMAAVKSLCTRGIVMEQGRVVFEGGINDSINLYLNLDKKKNTSTEVVISDSNRRFVNTKEIEFLSAKLLNPLYENCFANSKDIVVGLNFKVNKKVAKYRIAGSIFNSEEYKVGTFFTNDKDFYAQGELVYEELSIHNHNLAKGEYYFALSIGIGNEEYGNVEYDIVYEVLNFEITHKFDLDSPINKWPRDWGNLSFQSKLKVSNE